MQTTDLGSTRLQLLAAQNENRIKRDIMRMAFDIDSYGIVQNQAAKVSEYKSMMQPTASLPIPGIIGSKPKPVSVKVREPKTGRKFRA